MHDEQIGKLVLHLCLVVGFVKQMTKTFNQKKPMSLKSQPLQCVILISILMGLFFFRVFL